MHDKNGNKMLNIEYIHTKHMHMREQPTSAQMWIMIMIDGYLEIKFDVFTPKIYIRIYITSLL